MMVPAVERAIKIALTTSEQIVKKVGVSLCSVSILCETELVLGKSFKREHADYTDYTHYTHYTDYTHYTALM